MKWFVRCAVLTVMLAVLGCNASVKEVAPSDTGEAPTEQKMKDMQAESMKRMSPEMQKKMQGQMNK